MAKGRIDEARRVFCRLGSDTDRRRRGNRGHSGSLALDHHRVEEPFFRRQYRKPILLAVAIAMFNQLSGVNALWYYAPAIFRMAGAGAAGGDAPAGHAGHGEPGLHHGGPGAHRSLSAAAS